MTDISKEAIAKTWEEFEICARPNGSIDDIDLYNTDGMQDQAYTMYQFAASQAATIKALVDAGENIVKNASRQDLHGNGAMNDVVLPYLIDDLSAAIAAAKETTT